MAERAHLRCGSVTVADAEFDPYAWHDCAVWRLDLQADAPDVGFSADVLLFHLDYIAEWGGSETGARFRVAPATLAFHGVTDLCVHVDWGSTGFHQAVHEMAIDRIERTRVTDQKVFLDRPYYAWEMQLSRPERGRIAFGAYGFTLTLLGAPMAAAEQTLTWEQRRDPT